MLDSSYLMTLRGLRNRIVCMERYVFCHNVRNIDMNMLCRYIHFVTLFYCVNHFWFIDVVN